MSQRYGRKRKRAHLARITALEEENQRENALLRDKSRRLADLESEVVEWDAEIKRQFGEYSAIRRRTPQITSQYPIREMAVYQPLSPRFDAYDLAAPMVMVKERMRRFVFERHDDVETMRRHMRFVDVDGRGGVTYTMSEPAVSRGFGPREEEHIARTIARSMVNHWNGKKTNP